MMRQLKRLLAGAVCAAAVGVAIGADTQWVTASPASTQNNIVRLSSIRVDPAQLEEYKAAAAEVGRESMKNEPGVRVLYSMQVQKDPTQFYILEIYADEAAYKHHIATEHFQKYKKGTLNMVKDLQLIDCNPLVPEALIKP